MFGSPEFPPTPQSLPIVSEDTKKVIEEELGGTQDRKTEVILQGITREEPLSGYEHARIMTRRVFGDLNDSNPELVKVTLDVLRGNPSIPNLATMIDSATIGMAVVLRAFDLQTDHNLLLRMGQLTEEDIRVYRDVLQEGLPPRKSQWNDSTILGDIINLPKIPDQQTNLKDCIKRAQKIVLSGSAQSDEIAKGAAAMYKSLSKLWPKVGSSPSSN